MTELITIRRVEVVSYQHVTREDLIEMLAKAKVCRQEDLEDMPTEVLMHIIQAEYAKRDLLAEELDDALDCGGNQESVRIEMSRRAVAGVDA